MNSTQDAGSEPAGKGRKKSSTSRTIIEYVVLAVVAIAVALLIQAFLVKPYRIPSESMENTLLIGDRVLVDRISWRFSDPARQNIVVFHPPFAGPVLIKRIIGMPGDEVSLKDGAVYINGKKLDEPYVRTDQGQTGPVGPVRQRAAVVAADAVQGAGRQLLRDGRQPHRQRRQPGVRPRAARPTGGQGVRPVLAAEPHRRRQLEGGGRGRERTLRLRSRGGRRRRRLRRRRRRGRPRLSRRPSRRRRRLPRLLGAGRGRARSPLRPRRLQAPHPASA